MFKINYERIKHNITYMYTVFSNSNIISNHLSPFIEF